MWHGAGKQAGRQAPLPPRALVLVLVLAVVQELVVAGVGGWWRCEGWKRRTFLFGEGVRKIHPGNLRREKLSRAE